LRRLSPRCRIQAGARRARRLRRRGRAEGGVMLDRPNQSETDRITIILTLNGRTVAVAAPPFAPLAETLRERLGLTATKIGCDAGDCGACTVLLDGEQVCACLVPSAQADGSAIVTAEGPDELIDRLRHAVLARG